MTDASQANCGIPADCRREIPAWLVCLDNIPTAVLFVLGAALIWPLGWAWSVLFLLYCATAVVLFWKRICPYCHHFGTRACPCGYGVMARRFFQSKQETPGRDFRTVFRRNIGILFPCWFVPLGVGAFLLVSHYSTRLLTLLVAFCVVGFVVIPLISILVGCRACEIKAQCPWMTKKPKPA
jgi:hypothetical protein